MITRRTTLTLLGAGGCAGIFGDVPALMGASAGRATAKMIAQAVRDWVAANTREYDTDGGFMGRGHVMPVEEMLLVLPAIKEAGFVPWRAHSMFVGDRVIQIYGYDGSLSAMVWHSFVRIKDIQTNEIIAFEHTERHLRKFKEGTGLSLAHVLETMATANVAEHKCVLDKRAAESQL